MNVNASMTDSTTLQGKGIYSWLLLLCCCVVVQVALVGKGLTFDSGGYNLKVQGGIETMKVGCAVVQPAAAGVPAAVAVGTLV
jgi:hypothetical protein